MKSLIKLITVLFFCYILYNGYSIWTYGEHEKIPKADAAIVLGAAQWNGQPSPVFEGRLKQGIKLYKNNKVDYLVFTGGTSKNAIASEAEVGKSYAIEKGVPERDILFEDKSDETKANLINAKMVASKQGIDSYLLVSDQYHLKRAVDVAREQGMDVTGIATKYTAYKTLETKVPFFLKEWAYYIGHEVIMALNLR